MGFNELKKNIMDKAEKEADKLIKSAHKEAEDAKRQLELEMEESEKKSNEDLKTTIELIEKREVASANLEAKKTQLITKKEMIEKVFDMATKELDKKLDKKDRKALVEKLMKKVEKEIEVGKVYCNKTDAQFIKGKKTQDTKMLGGLIAEDKSGEVQVDYSFETMLDEIKERNISDITDMLFK